MTTSLAARTPKCYLQDRGTGTYGPYISKNNYVHDNMIVSTNPDTGVGAVADFDPAGMKAGNNRFNNNTYHMTTADDHFWWVDKTYTFGNFRSQLKQELDGSLSSP